MTDSIKLLQRAARLREQGLLPDKRPLPYHRHLLLKHGTLMPVQNTNRYTFPELKRCLKCLDAVFRIVPGLYRVAPLFVPVVRVDPVERHARLKDIYKRKPPMVDGLLHQFFEEVDLGSKRARCKAAVHGHGQHHRVERLRQGTERLRLGDRALQARR